MSIGDRRVLPARRRGEADPVPTRRHRWRAAIGWIVLALALAATWVLGVVGITRYQEATGVVDPLTTRLYISLQLFLLQGGQVVGSVPLAWEVARLLAPLLAAYAFLRVLAAVFRDQVALLRLRLVRRHVIVAGLGRKGNRLVRELLSRGEQVVVIEADPANPYLEAVRSLSGFAIVGDARDPATLGRARISDARRLVLLCGADATNVEIAARARELATPGWRNGPHCVVHLADPDLCLLLCTAELERYGTSPVTIDFVNVYAAAAQALLAAHPVTVHDDGRTPVVAVVGDGQMARHLLPAIARGRAFAPAGAPRLVVEVVGLLAPDLAALCARHPELERLADLRPVPDALGLRGERTPDVAYVCGDDSQAAVVATLEIRRLLADRPVRIVAVLDERTGLGRLLDGMPAPAGGPEVAVFGLLDEACHPDVLLDGTTEVLARALHETYRAASIGPGPDDPARRPWSELPEDLRVSNRDQAAHVAVKLAAIGQSIGPLVDWGSAQRPPAIADVEVMARLEHARWVAERRRSGWHPGPRDAVARTTPYLVSWDELTEEVREQDRMFVRRMPELLASVGLQAIDRTGQAGDPAAADERMMQATGVGTAKGGPDGHA